MLWITHPTCAHPVTPDQHHDQEQQDKTDGYSLEYLPPAWRVSGGRTLAVSALLVSAKRSQTGGLINCQARDCQQYQKPTRGVKQERHTGIEKIGWGKVISAADFANALMGASFNNNTIVARSVSKSFANTRSAVAAPMRFQAPAPIP